MPPPPPPPPPADNAIPFLHREEKAWKKVKTVVIDEVSMLDAEFFEWYVCSLAKFKLQWVLCGDFYQLPPVRRSADRLSDDEVLAIILYTMEDSPREDSLYFALNAALRAQKRCRIIQRDDSGVSAQST